MIYFFGIKDNLCSSSWVYYLLVLLSLLSIVLGFMLDVSMLVHFRVQSVLGRVQIHGLHPLKADYVTAEQRRLSTVNAPPNPSHKRVLLFPRFQNRLGVYFGPQ